MTFYSKNSFSVAQGNIHCCKAYNVGNKPIALNIYINVFMATYKFN